MTELPGFYYDAEKKRYFPLKGPIPGSSSRPKPSPPLPPIQTRLVPKKKKLTHLLDSRELDAPSNSSRRHLLDHHLSHPQVWKYSDRNILRADARLEYVYLDIQTPQGVSQGDALIAGSNKGYLSLFRFGSHRDHGGVTCSPRPVSPPMMQPPQSIPEIFLPAPVSHVLSSRISSIVLPKKRHAFDSDIRFRRGLITTLGFEGVGGSVCSLRLDEPLDYHSNIGFIQMIRWITVTDRTLWSADCNHDASQAVLGTNLGATLLDIETSTSSWVLRSKSDVFAQQFDQSGNIVLCGLRNGAIMKVDIRDRCQRPVSRLRQHRIQIPPNRQKLNPGKQWFELKGEINPSGIIWMPSSVCSLVSLVSDDQYFLASSMDGSILLYDHRMTSRGAVQAYGGHVNSHSFLQLSVDPSEQFLASGGEDKNFRLWNIKSGELLLEKRYSGDSTPMNISWQTSESSTSGWNAWFGTEEGIYLMRWR